MTAAEKLIAFIRNSFDTALYFAVMAVKENFRNYVGRAGTVGRPAQSMVILGNGPSLAGDLPRLIERREYETEDFLAVNFFAEDDRFEVVKPKYYVLSDPMFFRDSACRDRVRALYATLARKVAWPMNLYVQYYNPEGFDYRAALPNSNIRIVRFHTQMYRGFRSLEFWLFRRGLGSANFGTVVQVGEYVALLLGYKRIELYGVDHTLLDGLCVDDGNRLCRIDRHYYDGAEGAAAYLQEGSPCALYDGGLSGRSRRTVPRPRSPARLCRRARCADRQPHPRFDDRRLRTEPGVSCPMKTKKEESKFLLLRIA